MNKNEIATGRMYKYLQVLQDSKSKSHELYMDLLETLKAGHVEGKITMADLLLNAFNELGYMCKGDLSSLDKKEPVLDADGKPIIHSKKNNKYAADFEAYDKERSPYDAFYGDSKQGADWCAIFVHWVLLKTIGDKATRVATNIKNRQNHAAGVDADYWYYSELPQTMAMLLSHKGTTGGDQAFFYGPDGLCHTGLVVANVGGYVYILEGNTNPQVGTETKVIPEGKGVCLKRYSLDRIDIEFCRPLYKGISPASHGFDWKLVNKKIEKLYETLKVELEQRLVPEEMAVEEIKPVEVEKTKLQIMKNKTKVIKDLVNMGVNYAALCGRSVKDMKNTLPSGAKGFAKKKLEAVKGRIK